MSVNKQAEIDSLESRLQLLSKEYSKKIRKLEKHSRAAEARAYVQQRLKEEAEHTGTSVRPLTSSCQKPTDKSVRRYKTSDLKDRRKSTGSLKSEEVSVRNSTVSCLKPGDLQLRHKTLSSLKAEGTLLRNNTISSVKNGDKSVRQHKISSSNSQKLGRMGAEKLKHLPKLTDNESTESNVPATEAKSLPKMETDNSKHSISKGPTSKLRKLINTEICAEPVESAENIVNMDIEQLDTASTDSQDIFMSPLKQLDSNHGNKCESHVDTGNDTDTDQVIIIPGHDEQVRNSEIARAKNQMSKLKLSKYKKKNFVNPVKKEDLNIEKFKSLSVDKADCVITEPIGNKSTGGSMDNPISGVAHDISNEGQIGTKNTAQGTVYSEGQVIVFERQISNEDKENKALKVETFNATKSNITIKKTSTDFVEAEMANSAESSVSTLCDMEDTEWCEDKTKLRRKSGSRKRRSSGFEAQRRSSRIAGHPSQDSSSQSTESEVISPSFVITGEAAAKKRVIISSVFQCLVDEGRRRSDIEEFSIPADVFESRLKVENVSKLETYNQKFDVPIVETHCAHVGTKELMVSEKEERIKSEFLEEIGEINAKVLELPEVGKESCVSCSEKEEVISPTLFDSQSDSAFTFSKEKVLNEKEFLQLKEDEKSEIGFQSKGDNCITDCNEVQQLDKDQCIDMDLNPDVRESCLHLQQIASFQVPKSDNVHSVLCVETACNDRIQPYVVCLCSSCLKLYIVCNNQWTCVANTKLGFITRKKSGNLMYCLPDCDSVSVVLLGMKSDCTCINLYTYSQQKWVQTTLDKVFSKSIQVCPLSSHHVVISYYTDERTYLCKYTLDANSGQWSSIQLDSTDKHITHLVPVRGIEAAMLTITKSAEIQIWNYEQGYVLATVDISDVCPPDPVCTVAFAEQGFLLVPLLTKKKSIEAGSVVVINPCMSTSEALTPLTVQNTWTGCSNASVMSQGLLLCRQNNGCIRLWNVYTGSLLATVDDVIVTCFSATNQHLVAAHKQCVHVYKLNIPI